MAGDLGSVVYQGVTNRSLVDFQDLSLVTSDGILAVANGNVLTATLSANQFETKVAPDYTSVTLRATDPFVLSGSLTCNGTVTFGSASGMLKRTLGALGTAIAGTDYEPPLAAGTSSQYYRGDKTWATLTKEAVAGLTVSDTPLFQGLRIPVTGVLKTSGSPNYVVISAVAGTDYEAPIAAGTSGQWYRWDKTWSTISQNNIVGLTTTDSPTFLGLTCGNTSVGAFQANGNVSFTSYADYRLLSTGTGGQVTTLSAGTTSQYLRGDLTWQTLTAGVTSITGTAYQVNASASTGAVTLSLPQSIATTSTPQFASLGLGAAAVANRPLTIGQVSATSGSAFGILVGAAATTIGTTVTSGDVYGYFSSPTVSCPSGMTGRFYNMHLDTCAKTGVGTPAYAYGLFCASPNVSAPLCAGAYIESLAVGTAAWTDRTSASGYAYIFNGAGIGGQPAADRCLHVSNNRTYNTYSSLYPSSSSGSTTWIHDYHYWNLGALTGTSSATLYGLYSPAGGASNARVAASYGAWIGNGNWASSSANSYALYVDDISVGGTGNKVTNGIYTSAGIKLSSTSTTLTVYKEVSTSLTYSGSFTGSTSTITIKYVLVGKHVTLSFPQDLKTWTGSGWITMSAGAFPSEIRPAAVKNLTLVVQNNSAGAFALFQLASDGSALVAPNFSTFTSGGSNGFVGASVSYELS